MNIIIEGPDNSGKTTLAKYISQKIKWPIQHSEGPEKYKGEVSKRVELYLPKHQYIFDRHPVISQYIYNNVIPNTPIIKDLIIQFYQAKNLFIFCVGKNLNQHKLKPHDTPEYIAQLHKKFDLVCKEYDKLAKIRAHILYRKGDDMTLLLKLIKGYIADETT